MVSLACQMLMGSDIGILVIGGLSAPLGSRHRRFYIKGSTRALMLEMINLSNNYKHKKSNFLGSNGTKESFFSR